MYVFLNYQNMQTLPEVPLFFEVDNTLVCLNIVCNKLMIHIFTDEERREREQKELFSYFHV